MKKRVVAFIFAAIASGCSTQTGGKAVVPSPGAVAHTSTEGYTVTVLPSLGGNNSAANTINGRGWPMGTSFLSDDTTMHAALWRNGNAIDLKTLGGPNSAVEWPVSNDRGYVSGISETSKEDPLGESKGWSCRAFLPDGGSSGKTCLGFVWHDRTMRKLPTLGGNNGFGAGMNERDEIVGWAETNKHDATCLAPQVLQFLPVTWNAVTREVRALPTIRERGRTDPDGAATAVNRSGDVVGISGICDQAIGRFTARHAIVWHRGMAMLLKTIGGRSWNTPTAINDNGEIAGFLNRPGTADRHGDQNFISVVWTDPSAKPTKIGALPGDSLSEPTAINDEGVVLGLSFPSSHVFLWQNGMLTDFTELVLQAYPQLEPVSVGGINDRGEVAGQACELVSGACPASNPTLVTFLATPKN